VVRIALHPVIAPFVTLTAAVFLSIFSTATLSQQSQQKPTKQLPSKKQADTYTLPFLPRGLAWGMSEVEVSRVPGVRTYRNQWSNKDVLGVPNVNVGPVSFPVEFSFSASLSDKWEFIPSTGLNTYDLFVSGECREVDYFALKSDFITQYSVLQPEEVTGETSLKDRIMYFTDGKSAIRLYSRCNNPSDRYRWLTVRVTPDAVKPR
jgi:hypothetical protein